MMVSVLSITEAMSIIDNCYRELQYTIKKHSW